jgi:hypothetical protein
MEKNEVIERVNAYLTKAKEYRNIYPLDEVGFWQISDASQLNSGSNKEYDEYVGPVYHGSFLDVLAIAVQKRNFTPGVFGPLFGAVYKANIQELPRNFNPEDLEEKVRS